MKGLVCRIFPQHLRGRVTPHSVAMSCRIILNSMNYKKLFFKSDKAGLVSGIALLATLTGCVGYVQGPGPRAEVYAAPSVVVEPAAIVVVQDDYIYYPAYEVYYSSSRHECLYVEGGAWISRPSPPNISINVLFASPSIRVNFHDSPAHHHAAIVQQYPRNWSPSDSNQGKKKDKKDDKRDKHNKHDEHENNGRGPA